MTIDLWMKFSMKNIVSVDAADFPDEVTNWCMGQEIPSRLTAIVWIPNDGNPFAEWLKCNGFDEWKEDMEGEPFGAWIGIFST